MARLKNLDHLTVGDIVYVDTGRTGYSFNRGTVVKMTPKQVRVSSIGGTERTFRRDSGRYIGRVGTWESVPTVWASDDPTVLGYLRCVKIKRATHDLHDATGNLRAIGGLPSITDAYVAEQDAALVDVIEQARQLRVMLAQAAEATRVETSDA